MSSWRKVVSAVSDVIIPILLALCGLSYTGKGDSPGWFAWFIRFVQQNGVICIVGLLILKFILLCVGWYMDWKSRASLKTTIGKLLLEFTQKLQIVCRARKGERSRRQGELMQLAIDIATQLVPGKENATAILFKAHEAVDDNGPYFEKYDGYSHGSHMTTTKFYKNEGEGKRIWENAAHRMPVTWNTTWIKDRKVPKRDQKREYKTFITVPVYAQDNIDGLLTISSTRKRDLSQEDVAIMQILAEGLSGALSV